MATRGKAQANPGGNSRRSGRGNGYSVPDSADVGYSSPSGESFVVAVGLAISMILLSGFVTLTAFLYADLQAARGANKMIEKKMQRVIERCDRE
jgi:hypothetical protein